MENSAVVRWRYVREKVMQKTVLNRVDEEEKSDGAHVLNSSKLEDGANVSPLHVAAIMGNKAKMSTLLREHKHDIDKGDKIGRTPLIYSILGDRYECAEALLKAGADVNKTDVDERTALHWAAYQGNLKLVKLLLDKGALQRLQDKEGQTSLHLSLSHDNIKVMARLLKDSDIDCQDSNGMTALHFSVAYERLEHTKMLLHAKATPDCHDRDKKTVLHWAKTNKDTTIVSKLLDYERVMLILNSKDSEGRTALHLYVAVDNRKLVRYLTSREDCLLSEQDHMQRTPLHLAAILGHTEIAEVLLSRGCEALKPDNNGVRPLHYAAQNNFGKTLDAMLMHDNVKDMPDNDGRSALMWAAAKGAYDALTVLINHKQDLLASDRTGATALHMASEGGHLQCVNLLLQHQAGVNIIDNQQYTPLFSACQLGHRDVVETLLLHGAATDLEDKEGRTPLHWAAVGGITDICTMLISNGVDVSKRDKLGRPALHYAAYGGFYSCMSLLLESGADVDARDNIGVTALHWACASGSLDAVKLLVRHNAFLNYVETEGDKLTPLDYAIFRDHQDVAQFMIEYGAFTIAAIQDEAAVVIQKTWRGYRFRQLFKEQKQLLILHMKRRKETKLKLDGTGHLNSGQIKDGSLKDKSFSDEKFPELFNTSFDQLDNNVTEDLSSNRAQNDSTYSQTDTNSLSFHSYLSYNVTHDIDHNRVNDKEDADLILRRDFGQPQKDNDREKYDNDRYFSRGISSDSYGGNKEPIKKSQSAVVPSEPQPFHERNMNKDKIEQGQSYSHRLTEEMYDKISYTNDLSIEICHDNSRLSRGETCETNRKQDSVGMESERFIVENDFMNPRRARNRTIHAIEKDEEVERVEKKRSVSLNENLNVIERTTKLFNEMPTPSSSSSSLHGSTADTDLKPWQIYKRDRYRKQLIRRKIESAIIIQRAFKSHLSKQRSSSSNYDVENGTQSRGKQGDVVEMKNENKDEQTMQEIAALLIQLHWRRHTKKKLIKQQQPESRNSDLSDSRLLAGRDRKPKVSLHQRSHEAPNETARRKSSKSRQRPPEYGTHRSQSEGIELPNINNGYYRSEDVGKKLRDPGLESKSRPKSVALNNRKPSKSGPKISVQRQSRYSNSKSKAGNDINQPSSFKIHMPQSWSSNLQRFPLR